jgi:hypothetical protein
MSTCALTPRDDLTVGTNSNSSASVAEPTMPEAAKPQAPRPAVSGAYSPWSVAKPQLEPVVVERSLEERLERAERELVCARMIDNWHRCQQETARWSRIVTDLKRQIAERDAEVSHA